MQKDKIQYKTHVCSLFQLFWKKNFFLKNYKPLFYATGLITNTNYQLLFLRIENIARSYKLKESELSC